MWMFTSIGFFSTVQFRPELDLSQVELGDGREIVIVRSRWMADLDALMSIADRLRIRPVRAPEETPTADYPVRVWLYKSDWKQLAATLAGAVDYGNFKSSLEDSDRINAYMEVWASMREAAMKLSCDTTTIYPRRLVAKDLLEGDVIRLNRPDRLNGQEVFVMGIIQISPDTLELTVYEDLPEEAETVSIKSDVLVDVLMESTME